MPMIVYNSKANQQNINLFVALKRRTIGTNIECRLESCRRGFSRQPDQSNGRATMNVGASWLASLQV
jgi:hypothetical protein